MVGGLSEWKSGENRKRRGAKKIDRTHNTTPNKVTAATMKKFMIAGAAVKEMATRKSDNEPMLMMLNSTAGSDDMDDIPTDSLAYGHMRIRKDGSVMTETDIRELRQRQGFCVTCPGDPVKLYDVKRSKINPLYQKKEPIQVSNQSVNGICLKCNPVNQQAGRRGSGTLNADMLAGMVHTLSKDPALRNSLSRPAAMGLSMMGASSSSGGGISSGSEHSKPTGKANNSRSRSPFTRRSFAAAPAPRLYRSNSDESMNVTRSLTPTRAAQQADRLIRTLRRSNSDESLVPATGNAAKLLALAPPKSAFKRSQSNGFEETTPNLEGFTLTAGKNSYRRASQLVTKTDTTYRRASQLISKPDTAPTPSKSTSPNRDDVPTSKVQTKDGIQDNIHDVESKVIDPPITSGGGQGQGSGKSLPRVDSDGFFHYVNEGGQFGFHNSFVNFEPEKAGGMQPNSLASNQREIEDHDSVDNVSGLYRTDRSVSSTNSKNSKRMDQDESKSNGMNSGAPRAVEKPLVAQLSNQSLVTTASDTQMEIKFNLLQEKVVGSVSTSTARLDALDQQMTTVLQQQTLIIQQNATILQLLSNLAMGGSSLGMAYSSVPNSNSNGGILSHPFLPPRTHQGQNHGVAVEGYAPNENSMSQSQQQRQQQPPVMVGQDMTLTNATNNSFRSSTTITPTSGSYSEEITVKDESHQNYPSPSVVLLGQQGQPQGKSKSLSGLQTHMDGANGLGDTDLSSSYAEYEIPTNDTPVSTSKSLGRRRSSHKMITESRRDSKSSKDGSVQKLMASDAAPEVGNFPVMNLDDSAVTGVTAGASSGTLRNDTRVLTSSKSLSVPKSRSKSELRRDSKSSQDLSISEPMVSVSQPTDGENLFLMDRVLTDDRKDGEKSRRRSSSARQVGDIVSSSRQNATERSSSQKVKKKKKEKKKSSRRVSEVSATDDEDSVRSGGSPETLRSKG